MVKKLLLIFISNIFAVNFVKEFTSLAVATNTLPYSVIISQHPEISLTKGFVACFWFKYKLLNQNIIFSVRVNQKVYSLVVNSQRKLEFNGAPLELPEILPAVQVNDFSGGFFAAETWYFITLRIGFSADLKTLVFSSTLNLIRSKTVDVPLESSFTADSIIFGGNHEGKMASLEALFYNLYLIDEPIDIQPNEIENFSSEIPKPVLLAKFGTESSYSKWYTNVVNSGVGDILNGLSAASFGSFTNTATSKNVLRVRSHLINNLGVYRLPSNLLGNYQINNSYVFLIQYDLYYKDFRSIMEDNVYYHVLYQRLPIQGNTQLIRADIKGIFSSNINSLSLRYGINAKILNDTRINVAFTRDGNLKLIPMKFLMIKCIQNAFVKIPKIQFTNGLDLSFSQYSEAVNLLPNDRHFIGDSSQLDSTRRDYLSFINIHEVSFFRGAFIKQNPSTQSNSLFYFGFDPSQNTIVCRNTNNPIRGASEKDLFKGCEPVREPQVCNRITDCDICNATTCIVCIPGYQIRNGICVKCAINEGYDPVLKTCYQGLNVSSFFDTDFDNLKSTPTSLSLQRNNLLITYKADILPSSFSHSGFFFFVNSIANDNRLIDVCFDVSCIPQQELYYSFMNSGPNANISTIIVGNSNRFSTAPRSLIFALKKLSDFNVNNIFNKNIDCKFIDAKYFYQPNNDYSGRCLENCADGYYKDITLGRCIRCNSSCRSCIGSGICLSCTAGKVLVNGECSFCHKPCTTCLDSSNRCSTCSSANMFNDSLKTCDNLCLNSYSKNCEYCDFNNGNCLSCKNPFKLSNGSCVSAECSVTNCMTCESNAQLCQSCSPGYTLNTNKLCEVCLKNCSSCVNGYKLTGRDCLKVLSKFEVALTSLLVLILSFSSFN